MRRLAYMAMIGVMFAGPALAEEFDPSDPRSANWECKRPVADLSLLQIDRCNEIIKAARNIQQILFPDGPDKADTVTIYRGSRVGR